MSEANSVSSVPQAEQSANGPRAGKSSISLLLGVIVSPVETFQHLRDNPRWVFPYVAIAICMAVFGLAIVLSMDMSSVIEQQLQSSGRADQMSDEEYQKALSYGTKGAIVAGPLQAALWIFVLVPFVAGIFYIATNLLGAEANYRRMLALVAHGQVLTLLASILTGLIMLTSGTLRPQMGLSLLVPDPEALPGWLMGLLQAIEPFGIWKAVIYGFGLHTMTGLPRGKSMLVSFSLWVLYCVMMGALIMVGQVFSGGA